MAQNIVNIRVGGRNRYAIIIRSYLWIGRDYMRLIFKIVAAPFALVITIVSLFLTFILATSAVFFGIASGLIFLGAVILFIAHEPLGGVAFLVVAFLVSPFGIPALAGKLVGLLDNAGSTLRGFIAN